MLDQKDVLSTKGTGTERKRGIRAWSQVHEFVGVCLLFRYGLHIGSCHKATLDDKDFLTVFAVINSLTIS